LSGNPGGRPKGLARRVRELVGNDGHEIVEFMFETMSNEQARTADRLEAAAWLADRGFGKAVLSVDVNALPALDLSTVSTPDVKTLLEIAERSHLNPAQVIESGELRVVPGAKGITRSSPQRTG
jgi:hypothetical protein